MMKQMELSYQRRKRDNYLFGFFEKGIWLLLKVINLPQFPLKLHGFPCLQVKKAVTKPSLMDWKGVTAEMVGKVKELRNDENGKEL